MPVLNLKYCKICDKSTLHLFISFDRFVCGDVYICTECKNKIVDSEYKIKEKNYEKS